MDGWMGHGQGPEAEIGAPLRYPTGLLGLGCQRSHIGKGPTGPAGPSPPRGSPPSLHPSPLLGPASAEPKTPPVPRDPPGTPQPATYVRVRMQRAESRMSHTLMYEVDTVNTSPVWLQYLMDTTLLGCPLREAISCPVTRFHILQLRSAGGRTCPWGGGSPKGHG